MPTLDVPGVYIEELTGPGVITGVGTSTAAFVGPALAGPLNEARRVSSFDEFLSLYAIDLGGALWPYIDSPRRFYLAHGVRGFFENGGRQAYVVRVGTARKTAWIVENQNNEPVFRVRAKREGVAGNQITLQVQAASATGAAGRAVATGTSGVANVSGTQVTVASAAPFRVGDVVTENETARATIEQITGNVLTLSATIAGLANGDTLRIANLLNSQKTFRLADTTGIHPGSVVIIRGDDAANPGTTVDNFAVVESVNRSLGQVTLASSPARANNFNLAAATAPILISQEFRLIVTAPSTPAKTFDLLSLEPPHPGYVFTAVTSDVAEIVEPAAPPTAGTFPARLVDPVVGNVAIAVNGQDDDPAAAAAPEFEQGLNVLRDIDDVNLVCIPDAAAHADRVSIQQAMINHCLAPKLQDRFAILDSAPGAPPSGPGSVEDQRKLVESERGFAALYYPWLRVRKPVPPTQPRPPVPPTVFIPPSGHIAGVFARTDNDRGVHKAPANTPVRGVLGLERVLSDGQHGPLNLLGVNVLRIFPESAQVMVWGARTTVDPDVTDWLYVNVRRLMLFIEESIEEGIRFAVFEPNNLALWQKLKRTITDFLTRVWRDGALFGAKPDQAFYVRIDEALNPPDSRAAGKLFIEIGVAPVRPAEFIVVRIGLFDKGSEVSEG